MENYALSLTSNSTKLLFSTTRIRAVKGGSASLGTGFFFDLPARGAGDERILVTNKHVVEGAKTVSFQVRVIPVGTNVASVDLETVAVTGGDWIPHPSGLDLAFLPLARHESIKRNEGKRFYCNAFNKNSVPDKATLTKMHAIEDVVMVGYPNGLWDESNHFPILRRGATASHPVVDFNNRPDGVVDMGCFPGSSGSPVLICNDGPRSDGTSMHLAPRLILLGVLHSGPIMEIGGQIAVESIPTRQQEAKKGIPIHLGYYVKARELLEFRTELPIRA